MEQPIKAHTTIDEVPDGSTICVWFSCGVPSAVAAKYTLLKYGNRCNVIVANNPIEEEDEDNARFLKDVEEWLGVKIVPVINSKYPSCSCVEVWEERKFMSNRFGAVCTLTLKKQARYEFQAAQNIDFHVLGYTAEEAQRHEDFIMSELPNVIPVLIDEGLYRQDCVQIVADAGISIPSMYIMGYGNANCPGCPKATSPTYWNQIRVTHPYVFAQRAELSRRLGARLVRVKGKRIFLDELDPSAKGRPLKSIKMPECSIFCKPEKFMKS